jgi:hypothetical protein
MHASCRQTQVEETAFVSRVCQKCRHGTCDAAEVGMEPGCSAVIKGFVNKKEKKKVRITFLQCCWDDKVLKTQFPGRIFTCVEVPVP